MLDQSNMEIEPTTCASIHIQRDRRGESTKRERERLGETYAGIVCGPLAYALSMCRIHPEQLSFIQSRMVLERALTFSEKNDRQKNSSGRGLPLTQPGCRYNRQRNSSGRRIGETCLHEYHEYD